MTKAIVWRRLFGSGGPSYSPVCQLPLAHPPATCRHDVSSPPKSTSCAYQHGDWPLAVSHKLMDPCIARKREALGGDTGSDGRRSSRITGLGWCNSSSENPTALYFQDEVDVGRGPRQGRGGLPSMLSLSGIVSRAKDLRWCCKREITLWNCRPLHLSRGQSTAVAMAHGACRSTGWPFLERTHMHW